MINFYAVENIMRAQKARELVSPHHSLTSVATKPFFMNRELDIGRARVKLPGIEMLWQVVYKTHEDRACGLLLLRKGGNWTVT